MEPQPRRTESDPSLAAISCQGWDRLIEQVNAAALVVTIEGWLRGSSSHWCSAEDVWQETLLAAWRDRDRCEWRGPAAFRKWLLQIARHRLRDLADERKAKKRGGGRLRRLADLAPKPGDSSDGGSHYAGPFDRTSPDLLAVDRERAQLLRSSLAALPRELEPVVRLRLFEDRSVDEIATRLAIGAPAVRYRLRKGIGLYRQHLRAAGGAPTGASSVSPGG